MPGWAITIPVKAPSTPGWDSKTLSMVALVGLDNLYAWRVNLFASTVNLSYPEVGFIVLSVRKFRDFAKEKMLVEVPSFWIFPPSIDF